IDHSVTISNDGAGEAAVRAPNPGGGTTITINAGVGDVVSLRGLVIDGQGAGSTGIQIVSASAVHMQNSVIRNFEAAPNSFGIAFVPSTNSQLFVSDTIIFNNGSSTLTGGILIEPTTIHRADVVLDRVHLENNVDGLLIDGIVTPGPGSHVVVRENAPLAISMA